MDQRQQLWGKLYKAHYHSIYNFFYQRLGSTQDAADASQETFLRVVRNEKAYCLDSPSGYLWRTAQNLFREILRSSQSGKHQMIVPRTMGMDDHVSSMPDPEQSIAAKQGEEAILQIVESLSPRCRQVFIMHRFQGFSHQQIAVQLGISKKTVENHMVNALLLLRTRLSRNDKNDIDAEKN